MESRRARGLESGATHSRARLASQLLSAAPLLRCFGCECEWIGRRGGLLHMQAQGSSQWDHGTSGEMDGTHLDDEPRHLRRIRDHMQHVEDLRPDGHDLPQGGLAQGTGQQEAEARARDWSAGSRLQLDCG